MDEPVLPASLVVHVIRSEVVPPVEAVERARLLVELKQPVSIRCAEPDVPAKKCAWLAESLVQQEHEPLLKAKELPPWQHSIGIVLLVGPDESAARKGRRQGPTRHAQDKREAIQWPWSWNHQEEVAVTLAFRAE